MKRLVHIPHEVNQELQCLLCAIIPLLEPHRRISDATEDIDARRASPAFLTEDAALRGMVANAIDIVQCSRPSHMHAHPVRPRGDGRKMTIGVFWQNTTKRLSRGRLKVNLRDCGYDFMAWQ